MLTRRRFLAAGAAVLGAIGGALSPLSPLDSAMSHSTRRASGKKQSPQPGPPPLPTTDPVIPPGGVAPLLSGVWRGGLDSPSKVADYQAFGTWRGSPITAASTFVQDSSWAPLDNPPAFAICKQMLDLGIAVEIAVPPFAKGVSATLALAAAGSYESHWNTMLTAAAAAGLNDPRVYWRLAWEFNANFMNWGVNNTAVSGTDLYANAASFKTMWQRWYARKQVYTPLAKMTWCPNNTYGGSGPTPADSYPGTAYVDYHGVDFYDQYYGRAFPVTGTATEQASWRADAWNHQRNSAWGLVANCQFASQQGKPISFNEWGCFNRPTASTAYEGRDNPSFIQNARTFFSVDAPALVPAGVHHELYFNNAGTTEYSFLGPGSTSFPLAAAKYQELW